MVFVRLLPMIFCCTLPFDILPHQQELKDCRAEANMLQEAEAAQLAETMELYKDGSE